MSLKNFLMLHGRPSGDCDGWLLPDGTYDASSVGGEIVVTRFFPAPDSKAVQESPKWLM